MSSEMEMLQPEEQSSVPIDISIEGHSDFSLTGLGGFWDKPGKDKPPARGGEGEYQTDLDLSDDQWIKREGGG